MFSGHFFCSSVCNTQTVFRIGKNTNSRAYWEKYKQLYDILQWRGGRAVSPAGVNRLWSDFQQSTLAQLRVSAESPCEIFLVHKQNFIQHAQVQTANCQPTKKRPNFKKSSHVLEHFFGFLGGK